MFQMNIANVAAAFSDAAEAGTQCLLEIRLVDVPDEFRDEMTAPCVASPIDSKR